MKAEILKPMTVGGSSLVYGDIVEVSEWRNTIALTTNRYIRIIEEEVKPVKAEVKPKAKKAVASK
jgi:hypothetical protein